MAPAHDQPGLEVAAEPEAPQVVEGPTIQRAWDQSTSSNSSPHQQYASGQGGYGQYHPQTAYPDTAHTSGVPQSHWAPPSHVGTIGPGASEKGTNEPRIFGIKRRKFWLIVGPLIAIVVIALAVGLGVGLASSHNGNGGSSSSSSSSGSSSSNSTSSATGTSTTSSATATATATVTSITCPAANGTFYNSDNKKFLVLCNLDYNSGGGSVDLVNVVTASVEDCAKQCADNGSCAGAGWGSYYNTNYCWLKSSLGATQSAGNWFFVVKQ